MPNSDVIMPQWFPKDFRCQCAADDPATPHALAAVGQTVNGYISAYKMIVPLFDPTKPPPVIPKGLVLHHDICMACGRDYVTRAEITILQLEIKGLPDLRKR